MQSQSLSLSSIVHFQVAIYRCQKGVRSTENSPLIGGALDPAAVGRRAITIFHLTAPLHIRSSLIQETATSAVVALVYCRQG